MSELGQAVGLVAKEFGYRVREVLEMSSAEFFFLLAWLDWYNKAVRK